MSDQELLEQQRRYYRARAPEYDEWWQRQGPYDKGLDQRREWDRQVSTLDEALTSFGPRGDVLEIAGGTGWWTERLAPPAGRLTVVDSSPEVLQINRERVRRSDVDYVVADVFSWEPPRRFDVVFFSFWLSHVPRVRFKSFWSQVRSCLLPSGRVFLIDNREDPVASPHVRDPHVIEHEEDVQLRRLSDGSEHRVVKVMYEPDELTSLVEDEGWTARIEATRWFVFGSAEPRRDRTPLPSSPGD